MFLLFFFCLGPVCLTSTYTVNGFSSGRFIKTLYGQEGLHPPSHTLLALKKQKAKPALGGSV